MAIKSALAVVCLIVAALLVVRFIFALLHEIALEFRVRRSSKGRILNQTIAREMPGRMESPAWRRVINTNRQGRMQRVELALRELGE
jgi:hypothetical protein